VPLGQSLKASMGKMMSWNIPHLLAAT